MENLVENYVPLVPLPDRIGRLNELAYDLWWSWNEQPREVFRALDDGTTPERTEAVIVCEVELVDRCLTVRILDQGPGFVLPLTPRPEWSADDITTIPESGYGISIIQGVFPMVRIIARPGAFGLEMALTF